MARKTVKKKAATRRKATKPAVSKKTARAGLKETATRKTASRKTASRKTAARAKATRQRRTAPAPRQRSRIAAAATVARGVIAGAATAVASKLPWSKSKPDALQMLEQEHRRFEALLAKGEETTEQARKGRRELLATLTASLNEHELMEEKVLYPALQPHAEARDIVLEGFEEHHVADLIVKELQDVATNDEQWAAKFKVLKESIEHHIGEEEGHMFRLARGIFSRDELRDMATRMEALRR
jgi:hemerythrin-like domain-containing protein